MDKQSSQEHSIENDSDASNRALKPNLVAIMQLQLLAPDVLRDILSRLSLKEVMRMSMLSREWTRLRICHPDLVFTKETFGIDTTNTYQGSMTVGDLLKVRAKKMELLTRKFIDHVESVLRPLWSTSTTTTMLDKFVVKFGLRRKHRYYIDRWVIFSTASRAKHIALDFTSDDESCFGSAFDKYMYALPLTNFSGPNGSCVRSLYLGNIYLELPQNLCGITNLNKLTLNKVSINDGDLQLLLLSCALLESLNIEKCSSLSSLRIQQELPRLQYLRVRYCDLEILELDAPNCAFEFDDYLMQTVLTESSKLSDAIFVSNLRVLDGYDDVLDYIFTDLPAALPHLQTLLLLLTACQVQRFSNTRDSFICLRHLNMNLDSPLYHDNSWVMGFVNLLELAPLLEELEVHPEDGDNGARAYSSSPQDVPTEGASLCVDERRMFARNSLDKEEFRHILTIL